jgi:hypothetical protein
MSSKKKYQERLEQLERSRQAQREQWKTNGDALREKTKNYKGKDTNLNLTEKQIDSWATKKTGITPTQGSNADKKAGRTKGRFLKGKL